jgi:hypothetical protein
MIAGVGDHPIGEKPAAVLEAGGLRAVFTRRGDRFAHRIEVRDEESQAWVAALVSREGNDEDPWPPSPPFQQLHVEHRKEGDVVLLVGMAGRSHWSAAVDVCPERKTLRFDVAVRVQSGDGALGSGYEILNAAAAARIMPCPAVGIQSDKDFGFEPTWSDEKLPATICWRYSLGPA